MVILDENLVLLKIPFTVMKLRAIYVSLYGYTHHHNANIWRIDHLGLVTANN